MRIVPCLAVLALVVACAHAPEQKASDPSALRKELARELVARRDFSGALEVLGKLWRERPSDPDVLLLRGVVFRELGRTREARIELMQAIESAPRSAAAHGALAILLDEAGEPKEAIAHHQRAVELDPKNAAWRNNLGFSLYSAGKTVEAIAAFEEAMRLDPTNARIENNLGFALARTGDMRGASERFRSAGSLASAENNLGVAWEYAGERNKALARFDDALASDPAFEKARENRKALESEGL